MHCAFSSLAVALVAASALAAPAPSHDTTTRGKRSFTVPVKGRKLGAPLEEMKRAYRKYGWEIISFDPDTPFGDLAGLGDLLPHATSAAAPAPPFPTTVAPPAGTGAPFPSIRPTGFNTTTRAATTTTSASAAPTGGSDGGEVAANPEGQGPSDYLSPVTIGGQTLNLDFDTGSSDLWVYSASLPANVKSGHTVFDPSQSANWSVCQGCSWNIQYGDGSGASGSVGFDTVNIGGATVASQAVELATTLTGFSASRQLDGLLGLAFSSINTVQPRQQKTFFANIMPDLDQPVFTADLDQSAAGTYEFGSIDASKFTGEIHYTPVDNSQGFWQFDSPTYTLNGAQKSCGTCSPAIADTGTSLMIVDDDVAKAFYAQVQGASLDQQQGGYVYPCSAKLPDFGVAIGPDYTATIPGSELTYLSLGGGSCFGGVQSNGAGTGGGSGSVPFQIFGDVFLKRFFAVFDGGEVRLGIAEKNN